MSPEQFRDTLDALHLTQVGFSKIIDVNERTVRRWACGELPIPRVVELLLVLAEYDPKAFGKVIKARELLDDEL